MLNDGGGAALEAGKPANVGEWKQGLNVTTQVLTLSFMYKDNSKIQAYLTAKGEFLWYPLTNQVLWPSVCPHPESHPTPRMTPPTLNMSSPVCVSFRVLESLWSGYGQ